MNKMLIVGGASDRNGDLTRFTYAKAIFTVEGD